MPSIPWKPGPDGRASRCPVCTGRVPTGSLRGHVGSVRCLATVARNGATLTADQRALIDQGEAYGRAIRELTRKESSHG